MSSTDSEHLRVKNKRKNVQDATLKNTRRLWTAVTALQVDYRALKARVKQLEKRK